MQVFLVLIDSCCSAVTCMTINLQVFPGFCQILQIQKQYIDELVFKRLTLECDLGSAVNCLIMQPGQFVGTCIYHVEFGWVMLAFFIVKCLTLFFRVYSEWQWILSGVLCLNPSKKWGDYKLTQYQILQTNITRTVWQTVRRIANEILGVKGLSAIWWNKLKKEPIHS